MEKFEINKKYENMLKEELSYVMDDLKVINESDDDILPKVKEEYFVTYLLPYIIGNVENTEDNYKIFFNNWMKLVGDVVVGFYVVDDYGEILFKVPSFLGKFDDVNTPVSDISYITILKEFKAEYERLPEKAERELNNIVDSISALIKVDKQSVKEVVDFYMYLNKRYNLEANENKNTTDTIDEYESIDYED